MILRKFSLLLLALPLLAHADVRSELQAKYHAFDQAVARRDATATARWIKANTTEDFVYGSHDKNLYKRAKFEEMVVQQIQMTQKVVSLVSRITSVKVSGNKATVGLDGDTTLLIGIDKRAMKLVDHSHTVDDWVRVGKDWKLRKSIQTKSDTKMSKQ